MPATESSLRPIPATSKCSSVSVWWDSQGHGLPLGNAFVAGVHGLDGAAVPAEVDLWSTAIAYAIDKFVDQSDPFIKIGVLNGVSIVRCPVVVDVRTEAVGRQCPTLTADRPECTA